MGRGYSSSVYLLRLLPIAPVTQRIHLRASAGLGENRPAQRTFANPEGKKNAWREYRSENDAPEIQTFGQFAQAWTGPDGSALIRMHEFSEDWATYTEYCFSKIDQLIALRFEVRTAWGWGYREAGRISKGILRPRRAEFFNPHSNVSLAKPEGQLKLLTRSNHRSTHESLDCHSQSYCSSESSHWHPNRKPTYTTLC